MPVKQATVTMLQHTLLAEITLGILIEVNLYVLLSILMSHV